MNDYDLPEIPSDEELGITEDDRRALEDDGEGPGADSPGGAGSDGPPDAPPAGPPTATAGAGRWRGPVSLLLLLAVCLFASTRTGQVTPADADTPAIDFASARAMATLVELAREAHPTGSPEHTRVREALVDRLRGLGLEPEVQTTTSVIEHPPKLVEQLRNVGVEDPGLVRAATVRNIVARIPGSDPRGAILVTAHYDSRQISPGAGDDGVGVAVILEAVRALLEGPEAANDIIVLLTDAEELGLLGARAFVEEHRWMRDVDLVLALEMMGGGGPSVMFETKADNGWVIRAFDAFDPQPVGSSLSYEVYRRMPRDTDFTPFREAGVQGLNFAAIDNGHIYHQSYDTPENISESTLQHHGIHVLAALRYLGDADLTTVDAPDVVFFSVPGLGLVVYPVVLVWAVSALLVLLFAGMVLAARRAGIRMGRTLVGAGAMGATAVVLYLVGTAGFAWLTGFHPEYGDLQGSAFHAEGWYVVSLSSLALLAVVGARTLLGRWIAPLELAAGATLLPFLAALAAGAVVPLGAMTLQWPVAAALLSVTLMALLKDRSAGLVGWIVASALMVPVILVLQPIFELYWLAMSLVAAGVLGVVAVVGFSLCLPFLGALDRPNRWWAPAGLTAVAAAALGLGLLSSRPSPDRPAPSTLVYAYEHGSDSALWATSPRERPRGILPTPGRPPEEPMGSDQGRAWAAERTGRSFDDSRDLSGFGYRPGDVPVAQARVVRASPPEVEVVSDTVFAGNRRAVLAVRSRIGAEMVSLRFEGQARPTAIDGRVISDPERTRLVEHWGVPVERIQVEVSTAPDGPLDVHVVEHLLRPEELLGRDSFRRPPDLAPNVNWLSDRAMFRFSVGDFLAPAGAAPVGPGSEEPGPEERDVVTPPPDPGVPDTLLELREEMPGTVADTVPPDTLPVPGGGDDDDRLMVLQGG